ncbi:hypothetical protein Taro_005293 [Colocasia esculenta]|uniref:Uncharacterized protein n=1 Tax=Colocasia esculenta TaxID=4460 RepID=A0A843TSL2_COLES|nr:hypothetical protein [Colocasia esculenta]
MKYESGNAPKVQQASKKAGKALLPVDSQPKAGDRRMPCRTQITGTVIQLGMTFKGLSAEWTR